MIVYAMEHGRASLLRSMNRPRRVMSAAIGAPRGGTPSTSHVHFCRKIGYLLRKLGID